MNIIVDTQSTVPPSLQLVEGVLDALAAGELAPGERLPSVREMATVAMVNPNTVSKAYRELARRGVTETRNGSGVFVSAHGCKAAAKERRASTLEVFREAVRAALASGHSASDLIGNIRQLGKRLSKTGKTS